MVYKVVTTAQSEDDVRQTVNYIAQDSPEAGIKWWNGFWEMIGDLEELPLRFAIIPGIKSDGAACRSCFYHSHRIIYRVDESSKTIYILRVYHSAREPLKEDDLS